MKEDPYDSLITVSNKESPCLFTTVKGVRTTWEMTGSCPLKCPHCCIDASTSTKECELTLEKSREVSDQLVEQGVNAIYVSGGEPIFWKPLPEYLKYSKNAGIKLISIATSGISMDAANAKILKEAGADKVLISLDSHKEEVHDNFRGKRGIYNRAVSAINELRKEDIFVRVGTVVWSGNVDELENLTESMYKIGANEVAFSWMIKTGRAASHPEIFVPQKRYFEVGERLRNLKETWRGTLSINYHRFNEILDNSIGCQGGVKFLHIDPLGHMSPCSWITKLKPEYVSKGTIYTNSINDLINEGPLENFRKMAEKRESIYGPGCPAISLIENNSLYAKDPLYAGEK